MTLTIQELLAAVAEERKNSKADEDEEYIVVEETNNQWSKLFERFFLSPTTRLPQTSTSTTSDDDLIFYVTRKMPGDDNRQSHSVEVFRHHDVKRRPKLGSSDYDWEETTNLNLVLHQFEYTVTTAVCIKTDNKHLQVIKRLSTRVYASPSRRDMENKGTEERITYPNLYFSVDNFEDAFCEMVVNEGQMVCVELVAKNPMLKDARVLFLGSIKYEALKRVYDTRATASTRVAQRMSLGMYTKHRVEFVKMRGPNGKGHAEMAVSQHRVSFTNETTTTTQKTNLTPSTKHNSADQNKAKRSTLDNSFLGRIVAPIARQNHHHQNASIAVATRTVETNDYNEDSTDESGFLGRRLNQAMSWVRGSNMALDQVGQTPPLQTCLTYLTLPCTHLVKDLLETNSLPLLTA